MEYTQRRRDTLYDIMVFLDQRLEYLKTRMEVNPVNAEDGENVGLICTYKSISNPSSRVMMAFTDYDYSPLPYPHEKIFERDPVDNEFLISTINLYVNHPDKNVISMAAKFTELMQQEMFQVRVIPFRDILLEVQPDLDLNNYEGSFFPMIHCYNSATKEIAYFNVEAVVK